MKFRFKHWLRLVLVFLVMVVGLLHSAPAWAQSSANSSRQVSVSTATKTAGSAKDLLGADEKPSDSVKPNPSIIDQKLLDEAEKTLNDFLDGKNQSKTGPVKIIKKPNGDTQVVIDIPVKNSQKGGNKRPVPNRDR